ncbi:hypothetical protein ACFOY2_05160 [Nonomuraea purpurea]|uniref:Uncharacterized protein n=1 Tax=Nonomuraea purpurea TaxID=1849276 RepID=A0ABV8G2Z8_9ACTN
MADDLRQAEYGLYIAKVGTDERHHYRKGNRPSDLPDLFDLARHAIKDVQARQGHIYRLHGRWSTGVEIWESPNGDQDPFQPPDRLLAYARWEDRDLTLTDQEADRVR